MDESLPDIYGDLERNDLTEQINKLEERNETLTNDIENLANHVKSLNKEISDLRMTQETLKRNISELFKTAKAEMARKDRMIAELRKQVDDMVFKRNENGGQRKRQFQEEVGEEKPFENKRSRSEKIQDKHERNQDKNERNQDRNERNQDKYEKKTERLERNSDRHNEKSYQKPRKEQESYHKRDHHDKERIHHYSGLNHRKYDSKNDFRCTKYSKYNERCQDKKYLDNKMRDGRSRGIKDEKENKYDVTNAKNAENRSDCDSTKDNRISKVDLEAYVKIERTVKMEIDENIEVEKKDSSKNVKCTEAIIPLNTPNNDVIKTEVEIEEGEIPESKPKVIKHLELKNKNEMNPKIPSDKSVKLTILKKEEPEESMQETPKGVVELEKEQVVKETLSTSAQELQNAINSIKNESSEDINEETLQSIVDPTDSSIITQGNCIKLTSNCNKSFRSRRKRVVITVTD